MTKQELSRLYWLKREIAENQRRLQKLEEAAHQCTSQLTSAPTFGGNCDKSGNLAAQIVDLKDLLTQEIQQACEEYKQLIRYISSVNDPQMRLILSLRYVDGLKWKQIASRIGLRDEQLPRKWHNTFLKKYEKYETSVL